MSSKSAAAGKRSAAERLGVRVEGDAVSFDIHSLLASLGGWTGIVESAIPPTVFLVLFSLTTNALLSIVVSAALSLVSIAKQVITRKGIAQAVAGAVLIALSAWLALRGQPKDYFITGFITNAVYGSVMLLSILVRWPIIGVLVGALKGWGVEWRKNRALLTRFDLVTGIWVGLFATRLIVELPLYFSNNLTALGITKLILSEPAYAIVVWFTWLSLRSVILSKR